MNPTNFRKIKLACTTLALAATAGCGGEVLVAGASGASSGGSGGAGGAGGDCLVDLAAGLPEITLHNPTSGAFIGGALHLAVSVGEQPAHYMVLKIAGGAGYVVNQASDLDGPANLAPIDAQTAARVNSAGGALAVEVLDVSDPFKPSKKSSVPLIGTVPAGFWKVFSVVDNHLFTCLTSEPDTDAVMFDVPLDGSGPPAPVKPWNGWEYVCSGVAAADDSGVARGPVWLTWGYESDLKIFRVTPEGIEKQGEYNYEPDGVHQYGPVLFAATDEQRIVFDPGSNSEVFLYTAGSGVDDITHASFGLAGPKQLLAVVGHVSYWATAKGVRAYDVEDINAPKLLDFHADADFGEGLAAPIAEDATRLAVADAEGRLYVIPLGSSGPIEPLKTYLGEPGQGSSSACGSP